MQGSGNSSDGGRKREPISHAISPAAVSELGIHQVRTVPQPMHEGRGFTAPQPAGVSTHHCGSQGRHK